MSIIAVNNLTKYYGKARGIVDVSLQVEEGEIFGFIGPNGAGKSTTIRLLLSLIYPTSGSAKVFGKDVIKFGPEIRQEIGYLPSEVFYYDRMKVIDLLKYSASFLQEGSARQRIMIWPRSWNWTSTAGSTTSRTATRKRSGSSRGCCTPPN